MELWTAHIINDSCGHYISTFATDPAREDITFNLYESSALGEIEWYVDATGITIDKIQVITKG